MNNFVVFPMVIPLFTALILIFCKERIMLQRWLCMLGLAAATAASAFLVYKVKMDGIQVLHVGGWPAPFGITVVADMLSSLLALTACIVTVCGVLYAFGSIGKQYEKFYVYPFFLFLLCGVNGSFLTGDIFNLFVFFEVMLIASYVLLSLGSGKRQLRETLKYVMINVISSTLFVVAIAYLYSIVGTLNMAHLSERVAAAGQDGLLTTVSILFLLVFSIKAALVLYFWLPGSYGVPPAAISAVFAALLTKVGIYAIMRIFTLIFYHEPAVTHALLIWMGAATMVFGAIGAVAYWGIRKILAYNIIISVGFIVFGIGVASPVSLSGALYYLIHDMIVKALIFILGGAIISISGTDQLREINGLIRYRPLLGWLFFVSALALAGVPPLSGFVGKIMILQGGVEGGHYAVSAVSVITSLLVLYSVMKIFVQSFWGETLLSEGEEKATGKSSLLPGAVLAAMLVALGLGADWVLPYVKHAVDVLLDPSLYLDAVLHSASEVVRG